MKKPDDIYVIEANRKLIDRAGTLGIETVFDRVEDYSKCGSEKYLMCCRRSSQGTSVQPEERLIGDNTQKNAYCGASDISAAGDFVKMVAYGAAANSEDGKRVAEIFLAAARKETEDFRIGDSKKLLEIATAFGVAIDENNKSGQVIDRSVDEIAKEVGENALAQWERDDAAYWFMRVPEACYEILKMNGVLPQGIDSNIAELINHASPGAESDFKRIIIKSSAVALADGWGSSMTATELQDVLFGSPYPVKSSLGIGVLKKDRVNILFNGYDTLLGERIVKVLSMPEMECLAKEKGAEGIQLCGMGCIGNELLMRYGIPIIDSFQQEFALITGAVDVLVSDLNYIIKDIDKTAKFFHTKIITTNPYESVVSENSPKLATENLQYAKKIVLTAIENFSNRKMDVIIPDESSNLVTGFSCDAIKYSLGGTFKGSYKFFLENIINGRIRGIAVVVGGNTPFKTVENGNLNIVKELLKHDVIVLTTGCILTTLANESLLNPESASAFCGPGLAEVCEALGIPPVLHMGSCTNSSRILIALNELVKEAGLNKISDFPAAVFMPGWISGADVCIGQCFVASGLYTTLGERLPVSREPAVKDFLCKGLEKIFGGMWDLEQDPVKLSQKMLAHIDKKREKLGIDKVRERVLVGMEDRRELEQF